MIGAAFLFFVTIGILVVMAILPFAAYENSKQKQLEQKIEALPGFTPSLRFNQSDNVLALMLDPESNQFAIASRTAPARLYGFDQLVAVEIERDGVSLEKTNRGSQMVGATVGGVLLGPVGLLLGGLTGSKREERRVKRLSLKLYTNDLYAPLSEVIFFDHHAGVQPDSKEVQQAARELDEWYGRFQTILRANQQSVAVPSAPAPSSAVPDMPNRFGRRRGLLAQD